MSINIVSTYFLIHTFGTSLWHLIEFTASKAELQVNIYEVYFQELNND